MTTEINAEMRLATYGTLAPGRANEDQLSMLTGEWSEGWVFGRLLEEGWGAEHGCPGIVLGPDGSRVDVYMFIPSHHPSCLIIGRGWMHSKGKAIAGRA